MKIKLSVACEILYFELEIFSFNSYVCYLTRGFIASTLALNLLTRAFNLLTRAFSFPTRPFNLVTRAFSVLTCQFELVAGGFELLTSGFELVTRGFELVTRRFELVTRGFELMTRVLLFHILIVSIVLHYLELIKLQQKHKVLYLLWQILLLQLQKK